MVAECSIIQKDISELKDVADSSSEIFGVNIVNHADVYYYSSYMFVIFINANTNKYRNKNKEKMETYLKHYSISILQACDNLPRCPTGHMLNFAKQKSDLHCVIARPFSVQDVTDSH